jgi:hypothetical protein
MASFARALPPDDPRCVLEQLHRQVLNAARNRLRRFGRPRRKQKG